MTDHRHIKHRASGRQSQVAFSWRKVAQLYACAAHHPALNERVGDGLERFQTLREEEYMNERSPYDLVHWF
jgi:hypothetical protein